MTKIEELEKQVEQFRLTTAHIKEHGLVDELWKIVQSADNIIKLKNKAIETLLLLCQNGDFKNGVEEWGMDEGDVKAGLMMEEAQIAMNTEWP